jgi:hypothetical protein
MHRLYLSICKRWGPSGLTLSAWAWKHFLDTGSTWLRDRIDGAFLLLLGQRNHCQAQYQRETRA